MGKPNIVPFFYVAFRFQILHIQFCDLSHQQLQCGNLRLLRAFINRLVHIINKNEDYIKQTKDGGKNIWQQRLEQIIPNRKIVAKLRTFCIKSLLIHTTILDDFQTIKNRQFKFIEKRYFCKGECYLVRNFSLRIVRIAHGKIGFL